MTPWLNLATERSVVRRALGTAVVVGAILVAINHGDALLRGDVSLSRAFQIGLTVLVPYCVSTYSSVGALRQQLKAEAIQRSAV
ncbi:MAG: nitrate/nitrite transporter NrtS [Acidobacteria bacterium]|nr:nitrate/nitrite transporter NrtS [Acidobacteriota bacterium]